MKEPIGVCKVWDGDPPLGQKTHRENLGGVGDWKVVASPGKYAAQVFRHPDGTTTKTLWFPTSEMAIRALSTNISTLLPLIVTALEACEWGPASIPGDQKWLELIPDEAVLLAMQAVAETGDDEIIELTEEVPA